MDSFRKGNHNTCNIYLSNEFDNINVRGSRMIIVLTNAMAMTVIKTTNIIKEKNNDNNNPAYNNSPK